MPRPAIVLEQVTKRISDGAQTVEVLRGVDLVVEPGELVAILGASGSGKSTLLHIIGGLDRKLGGRVEVAGQDLAQLNDARLSAFRARTVGFVFQAFNLLPGFSAVENVYLPGFFGQRAPDDHQRATEALVRVGLGGRTHRRPGELSGGERQRVAVARALFTRPPVLLADEPTGNLDAVTGADVIELFRKLNREDRTTLVIVTHEERVSKVADRVLRLSEGRLIAA
jgi:putative ABC transport system ATP-binding protein